MQLKKRYDLIPNLVETVKGYTKHEKTVFESVTKARANALGAQTVSEKAKAEGQLSQALKSIFAGCKSLTPTLSQRARGSLGSLFCRGTPTHFR